MKLYIEHLHATKNTNKVPIVLNLEAICNTFSGFTW